MNSQDPQKIGRVFGWFFVATFFTSIPAYFSATPPPGQPRPDHRDRRRPYRSVALGAALEVFLIIFNVATAVVLYPILKRESEIGADRLCPARLVEGIFIAIGVVSALAFLLMHSRPRG